MSAGARYPRRMEAVTAALMIALTGLVFVVWRVQARGGERWARWFRQAIWRKAMVWTAALTMAAVAGSLLGGGTEIAGASLALGLLVLYVLFEFWSSAKTFGPTHDRHSDR